MTAMLLGYLMIDSQVSEDQLVENIESNVAKVASNIAASFAQIKEDNFPNKEQNGINYFLFSEDGDLVKWTSNDYVPTLEEIRKRSSSVVLANDHGEFIFRAQEIRWYGKTTILVGLSQVRRKFSISNSLLEDQYNSSIVSGNIRISNNVSSLPIRYNGQTLFYIESVVSSYFENSTNTWITFLMTTLLLCVLRVLYVFSLWLKNEKGIQTSAFLFLVSLLVLRFCIYLIDLPSAFGKLSVFDEAIFNYNWFYPSLGDGIINLVFINVFLIFLLFNGHNQLKEGKRKWQFLFGLNLILGSYVAFYLFADSIQLFQRIAPLSLDIASSLAFPEIRIAAFMLIILLALFFFLIHFLSYRFISKNLIGKQVLQIHIIGFIIVLVLALFNTVFWIALAVNAFYLFGIYYFRMPDKLSSFRFSSINYLLFTCIVLACVGTMMIYEGFEKNQRYEMQQFASFLQLERDIEGEYLLSDIVRKIERDDEINEAINDSIEGKARIARRIERVYLKNYFHDFEFDFYFFNKDGHSESNRYRGQNQDVVLNFYKAAEFSTAYPNIFYDGRVGNNKRKKYLCFVSIGDDNNPLAHVLIEIVRRKVSSKRVLPQLLLEGRKKDEGKYDYAFLVDEKFNYTSGNFDYEAAFDRTWLLAKNLYRKGIEKNGYHHLAVKVGNRTTIVSQKTYPNDHLVSNFSFLFIVLLVSISLAIAMIMLLNDRLKGDLNFSTKIMAYSIASFVVPLMLVAIAVLSTTDRSNRLEIDKSNVKSTLLISESLDDLLYDHMQGALESSDLENEINELALHASRDLNVYDSKGVLFSSSTPEIFEKEVISAYINPVVLHDMLDENNESLILNEEIGNFQYKTSYVGIRSPDTGQLLGVLASPYFGSKNHVKRQQLQVFGNIINIFTFIFIASIWLAYWVVSKLTSPIVQIADKLHQTGFVEDNQPLEWHADDEIGLLVKEYNNMLSKLEETKMELARNEKEAAWREMAKQVAHEIKNPLTPMKLTIQHLSRILSDTKVDKKSLDILLSQIDTLDDIVTSFSHFAKMPSPQNEPFDIVQTLQKSAALHVDKNIILNLETTHCIVHGDIKLFGRVFNNLILNAFESMKSVAAPKLMIDLSLDKSEIQIRFEDCGEGISDDIKDKVFIPNFSTKDAGSGIGLAVAKRGIEHAGGKIWFDSEAGKGTSFFIHLPVHLG